MSLTSPVPDEQGIAHTATGQACFYCGEPLQDPAVHWSGFPGSIYLHPECVPELVIRLFRDLHELRCPGYYQRLRLPG